MMTTALPYLTSVEFTRLDEARRLQVERYRTAFFRKEGKMPREDDRGIDRTWLRVSYEGRDCCIPIKLMAAWGATFPEGYAISFTLAPNGMLTLSRGSSRLRVYTLSVESNNKGEAFSTCYPRPLMPLPDAPVVITPGPDGKALFVAIPEAATEELGALRAETTTNRKALAKERAIQRALKAERLAKETLDVATQEATEAQAVIDSMTLPEALTFARRCLKMRRTIRADVARLEVQPSWLTGTYQDDGYHHIPGGDGDELERSTITVDAVTAWNERVDALIAARVAKSLYKPRLSWPRWLSTAERKAQPERATKVYGPAFDKLVEAEKRATESLQQFLRARFEEHCDAAGLPGNALGCTDYEYAYLEQCRRYSRARLLLRTWPQRQADLESAHREAVMLREQAEA